MNEEGRIVYTSELDDKGFTQGAQRIQSSVRQLTSDVESSGKTIDGVFDDIKKHAEAAFAVGSLIAFQKKIIDVHSEMESLQKSFETLVGERVGKKLYEDMKQFATTTPMMMNDLAKGAQTLLGFNIEAEKVMPILRQIGDISMGDAQKFNSLTLAFAQMSSTGKLMGQDLLQMINAGFNPLVVISEKTGKSVAELKDEMSKGAISVEMVEDAFRAATGEGGKFHNMLETQSKTLKGAISNMQGAYQDMLNAMGEAEQGVLMEGVNLATELMKNYEAIGKVILQLIATYGSYKAAVIAVSVAEDFLNGKYVLKTRLLRAAAAAQELLNKAMLKNPAVLVATGVLSLVSALVIFKNRTDDAAAAQKKLDEAFSDTQANIASEQKNIDKLFDKLRNAKKGTDEYKNAKDAILNQYGKYLKGLGDEANALSDVEAAYKAVTKAAREATLARGKEAALKDVQDTYGQNYSQSMTKMQHALNRVLGDKKASKMLKSVQKELRETGTISAETEKKIRGVFHGDFDYGNSASWITGLRNNEKYLKEYSDLVEQRFQLDDEEQASEDKKKVRNKKAIEDDKKNLQAKLDNLSAEEAAGKEGIELKKKINALDKELKAYDASDKSGNKAATERAKLTKEQREYLDMQKQIAEQRKRNEFDLWAQTEQAAIEAMHDGTEKTIRQIELDFKQRKESLSRQYADLRRQKFEEDKRAWEADPKHKNSPFAGDIEDAKYAPTETEIQAFRKLGDAATKVYETQLDEARQKDLQSMRDYLKEYGTFQQQKLAIAQEYAEKIRKAEAAGNTTEAMRLRKEQDTAFSDTKAREFARNIDFTQMLDGVGNIVKEIARQTFGEVQKYKKTDEYRDSSAESKKAIADLEARLVEKGGAGYASPFNGKTWDDIHNASAKFRKALDDLTAKEKEHEAAIEEVKVAEENLALAEKNAAEGKGHAFAVIAAKAQLSAAKEKVKTTGEAQQQSESQAVEAQGEVTTATTAAAKGLQDFNNALSNITSGSLKGFTDGIMSLISQLTGKDVDLTSILGDKVGGIIGAIIGLIDALGDDPAQFLGDLVDKIFGLINGLLEQLFSGELVEKLVEAIVKGVTELIGNIVGEIAGGGGFNIIFNTIKGVFGGIVDGISKGLGFTKDTSAEVDAAIQASNDILESIDKNVDRIASEMKESYGAEAMSKYEELLGQYRNQGAQYNGQIQAAGWGYYGNRHSEWYYRNENGGEGAGGYVDRIRRLLGMDQGGYGTAWQGFFNQLQDMGTEGAHKLATLRENAEKFGGEWAELWFQINNTGWDDEGRISAAANAWANTWGQMEESAKQLREILAGTSFDSVFDDYMNRIYEFANGATDAFDDVGDAWQEMVNRMVINNFAAQRLKNSLKAWYDKFSQAYDDQVITEKEIAALRREYFGIVEDGKKEVEALQKMGIVQATDSSKRDQQSATFNSAQNITHEQADALVGIALNHTMLFEQGNQTRDLILQNLNVMQNLVMGDGGVLSLISQGNQTRETMLKAMKEHFANFEAKMNRVITELQNQ